MRFSGKTAVVTGSSGIGLGVAEKLASEGARLHLWGIDEAANATARERLSSYDVTVSKVDVSSEHEVATAARSVPDAQGHVHILVNAAGIQTTGISYPPTARTGIA